MKILEKILYPAPSLNNDRLNQAINGKTILITGASYGIGEQTAYMLARNNMNLILVARTESKLLEVKQDLEKQGANVYIFVANLYKEEEVRQLIDNIKRLPHQIDIFISNAGKSICRPLMQSLNRFHDFTRTMSINYYTPVELILALIPDLKSQKGQIINISAINVLLPPTPYWAAYQASKAAFDNWVKCSKPEFNVNNIAITSVYLPLVRTRMIEPNESYRNVPTMIPETAAKIICRAIIKRNRKYTPWWLVAPRAFSLLFSNIWEGIMTRKIKKSDNSHYTNA